MSSKSNRMLRTVMFIHVHVRQFVQHSLLDYHFGEVVFTVG